MRPETPIFRLSYYSCLLVPLFLLSACSTPQGGSARMAYNASLPDTFALVRDSMDRMGYAVIKEDLVSGEIQGVSAPYGAAPRQCQGNELWVFLSSTDSQRTEVYVQEWYRGGNRLLSKTKENCEPHARKLISTIGALPSTAPSTIPAPSSFSSPLTSTKSELLLDEGIQSLVSQLGSGLKEHRVARLAVLPITDGSRPTLSPLSTYLSDKITNALYAMKIATVVERTRLVRIMDELEMTSSLRFDDRSIKSVGKLAGVDAIVLGLYSSVGSRTIEINARVVSVETAELLGVGSVRIPQTAIQELLR